MATGGYINNGVRIGYSASSPVSWTRIGQVAVAPTFGIERDKVDSTVHGTSIFKRSMPGMAEVPLGEMVLIADLNPSTTPTHDAMRSAVLAGTTYWFRIEFPVDRSQSQFRAVEFQAYVRTWMVNGESPEERQEIQCALEFDSDYEPSWKPVGAAAVS